jgi:hypothetical protein
VIAFLTSRLGILSCAGGALLLVALYAWGLQERNGRLELEKAAADIRTASLQRDVDAAKSAEVKANEIIRGLAAESAALDTKVKDYENELETRPDSRCGLTDADVRRLRDIAG